MSNRIQVNVTRGITNVVQVNTAGPQGQKGETGATGADADPNAISGSLHLTGSLTVSSSNVDFSNATSITGSTFSGSLFIGSFQGNGSLLTAVTASQQPSGPDTSVQFRDGTDNSGSSDFTFNKTTGHVFIGGAITASGNLKLDTTADSIFTIRGNSDQINQHELHGRENLNSFLVHNPSSNLGVGITTPSVKLHVSGAISASGNIVAAGNFETENNITATEITASIISASNNIFTNALYINQEIALSTSGTDTLILGNSNTFTNYQYGRNTADLHNFIGHVTASGNISSSASVIGLTGSFTHLKGNSPITVGDIVVFQQTVSGSVFSGSFVGDASGLTGVVADGTLSSSAQIGSEISGAFTATSGGFSTRVTANEVITTKTLISGSSQITYSSISSIPSGIYSSSLQTLGNVTASGNISSSGRLIGSDLNLTGGDIDLKNAGAQSNIKFYCESSNAHYTKLQAALHADYSGNPTTTLPAYDFDFKTPSFDANVTASGNISSSGAIFVNGTNGVYLNNVPNVLYGTPTNKLIIGDEINNWPNIDIGRVGTNAQNISLYGPITASGDISSSGTITANAFSGGGAGITGVVSSSYALTASFALNAGASSGGSSGIFNATGSIQSTTNNLRITGSVFIDDTSTAAGTADANAVFKVKGTEGNLITVTNNLTNLLDVKDVSGVSVFQVSGSGEVIMKDLPTTQPNVTGSLWISGSGTPPGAAGSGYLMVFVG